MRVLLVEDDRELAARIAEFLRAEHFAVDIADNGEDGQHLGETEAYDAAVLDLGLPQTEGAAVLRAWRAAGRTLPVLVLTALRRLARQGGQLQGGRGRFSHQSRFGSKKCSCGCARWYGAPQVMPTRALNAAL